MSVLVSIMFLVFFFPPSKQTEEEVGDNIRKSTGLEFTESQRGEMAETGCEIICGAPTTLAVKE